MIIQHKNASITQKTQVKNFKIVKINALIIDFDSFFLSSHIKYKDKDAKNNGTKVDTNSLASKNEYTCIKNGDTKIILRKILPIKFNFLIITSLFFGN